MITGVDAGVALALGLVMALLCHLMLAPAHLDGPRASDDFGEYCSTAGALAAGAGVARQNHVIRPVFPGLLASLAVRALGVVDGLALASLVCFGLLAAVYYLWGVVLHGRAAGVLAAVALGGVGPLVVLSRHLSFYPELVLLCSGGGLLVSVALRGRDLVSCAAGGAGVGLVLLGDQVAIFWALPLLGGCVVAALLSRRRLACLAAVALPLALSWLVAAWLPPQRAPRVGDAVYPKAGLVYWVAQNFNERLEEQHLTRSKEFPGALAEFQRAQGQRPIIAENLRDSFLWGHSDPLALPANLLMVWSLARLDTEQLYRAARAHSSRPWPWQNNLHGWLLLGALACLLSAVALRRRPALLLAVACAVAPCAIYLSSSDQMTLALGSRNDVQLLSRQLPAAGQRDLAEARARPLVYRPKFVARGLAPLPVLLGLALAALAHWMASWAARNRWGARAGQAAQAAVLVLALVSVLGLIPWRLSAQGTVLRVYRPEVADLHQLVQRARGQRGAEPRHRLHADERICVDYLRQDLARGRRLPASAHR